MKVPENIPEKLWNWNVISTVLARIGLKIGNERKSLIVAGDRESLVSFLASLRTLKKPVKKVTDSQGGVFLDAFDPSKDLQDSENCLEFLILSLCRSLELSPRQSAGLLTQNCAFLAQIIVKGINNSTERIVHWYQGLYAHSASLAKLITQESSVGFIFRALQPGIISNDIEVVEWCFRTIPRLALDLTEHGMGPEVWEWLVAGEEPAISMVVQTMRRLGGAIYPLLADLLLQVAQDNYYQLLCEELRKFYPETVEYFEVVSGLIPFLVEGGTVLDELCASGVISRWVELALQEGGLPQEYSTRGASLTLLVSLLTNFYRENTDVSELVFRLLSACGRDESVVFSTLSIGLMFHLLEFLVEQKSENALSLYKSLAFLLIEHYSSVELREFILLNFCRTITAVPSIPLGVLVEPLVKILQCSTSTQHCSDIEFFTVLAEHPRLSLKHAIQLLDAIGSLHIQNLVYARAYGLAFTSLVSRFITAEPMQEYLLIFTRYNLSLIVNNEYHESLRTAQHLEERHHYRAVLLNLINWVLQQRKQSLNEQLKPVILEINAAYCKLTENNCGPIMDLLVFFGDPETLVGNYVGEATERVQEIFPLMEASQGTQASGSRVLLGIGKAKQKYMEKVLKLQQEEDLKVQVWERPSKRNFRGTVAPPKQNEAAEVLILDNADSEHVDILLKKYLKLFKILFQHYAGTGSERKPGGMSDFDWLRARRAKLTEAELTRLFTDYAVIPRVLSKEELKSLIKQYCLVTLKQQEIDFAAFPGVFSQVAFCAYSRPSHENMSAPPVFLLRTFITHFQSICQTKDVAADLFGGKDPRIEGLTQQLRTDPETALPEGYIRVPDIEISTSTNIPDSLNIPENVKISYELLHEIVHSALDIPLLSTVFRVQKTYRAKAAAPKKPRPELPPIYERDLKRNRSEPKPKKLRLSRSLQRQIKQVKDTELPLYEECAKCLDHIMNLLVFQHSKLVNRPHIRYTEKVEVLRAREEQEEMKKTQIDELKRSQRQKILQELMAKNKEKRILKKQEFEQLQRNAEEQKSAINKARAEKEKKLRNQKEKMLRDWTEKKYSTEEKHRELSNKPDPNKLKEIRENQKRHRERLDSLLKEKQAQLQKQKQVSEKQVRTHKMHNEQRKQLGGPEVAKSGDSPSVAESANVNQ